MLEQNQAPKQIENDEDRISLLPDCVIILEILSRLPTTKDAVRTSLLTKRWRSLWTSVPNLVFINNNTTNTDEPHRYFFSCVDKTITQCRPHLKLNKFQLHSVYECKYESQVNKWIRYAINCNVQDLDLHLWGYTAFIKIVLDDLLFNNSIFTHLKLSCSFVNPTGTFSWKNLKSLYISMTDLNEDLIQNILSGSPRLETFTLDNCYGFCNLDITSKSVKNFVISGDTSPDGQDQDGHAYVKAPNILSLKILGSLMLCVIWLDDLSSLVEAHFDYSDDDYGIWDEEEEEERLGIRIDELRHVKELTLGVMCSEVLSRMEAKGYIAPSNIKRVVDDDGPEDDDEVDC